MKKIFIFVLIIMLILSTAACKKAPEEQTASEGVPYSEPESEQQQNESQLTSQQETQSTEQQESAEQQESEEAPTQNNETEKVQPRAVLISIEKDDKYYTHYINGKVYSEVFRDDNDVITAFDGVDTKLLSPTGKFTEVCFEAPSPTDGTYTVKKEQAELYTLPDELENDPYIDVIAAKPESYDDVIFFMKFTDIEDGEPYYKWLCRYNRAYGYKCIEKENLVSLKIYKERPFDEDTVTITDKQVLGEFYERICGFTCVSQWNAEEFDFICFLLEFEDGKKIYLNYNFANGIFYGYKADDGFGDYVKTLIE